jgi:arylsulfatase A
MGWSAAPPDTSKRSSQLGKRDTMNTFAKVGSPGRMSGSPHPLPLSRWERGATSVLLLAAALAGLCVAPGIAQADPAQRPNIVFVLTDDLGYGDLGCYGQKIVATPNLDRIAAEGIRFTQAYAGNNCCAPSRCAFLTGLHSGHGTVRDNSGSLGEKDVTIAAVLRKAGYATGHFGKWHLGGVGAPGNPLAQGFDFSFGINPGSGGSETHFSTTLYRNGKPEPVAANQDGRRGVYGDDLFLAEAISFIREHHAKPFFVYLALRTPHKSLEAPADVMKEFEGKFQETPFKGDAQIGGCPAPRAARAAMITHLDRIVPRLFATLKELQLERNTLVIFTSDNGPAKAGGADPEFFGSAGSLRGLKFTMYEGGIRIPMIAWWPGTVPAGVTCDFPCAFWDFMPTFTEMAGVPCPKTDGISILSILKGNRAAQKPHDYFYWERAGQQAVHADDWKGILTAKTGGLERFNLKVDPREKNDVQSGTPEIAERLRTIINSAHVDDPRYPLSGKVKKAGKRVKEKYRPVRKQLVVQASRLPKQPGRLHHNTAELTLDRH